MSGLFCSRHPESSARRFGCATATLLAVAVCFFTSSCSKEEPVPAVIADKFGTYVFDELLYSSASLGKTKAQMTDRLSGSRYEIYPEMFEYVGQGDIIMYKIYDPSPSYVEHEVTDEDLGINDTVVISKKNDTGLAGLLRDCDKYCEIMYDGRDFAEKDIGYILYYDSARTYLGRFEVLSGGERQFQYIMSLKSVE
ncbi:MAG: hypothetical protein K6C36_02420 [Clostridia bacterium]|nr:hypothetical protein [Clostridia bacterium]